MGADSQATIDFSYDGSAITEPLPIALSVRVSVESLLGPETTTSSATLKVTSLVTVTPHKLDDDG